MVGKSRIGCRGAEMVGSIKFHSLGVRLILINLKGGMNLCIFGASVRSINCCCCIGISKFESLGNFVGGVSSGVLGRGGNLFLSFRVWNLAYFGESRSTPGDEMEDRMEKGLVRSTIVIGVAGRVDGTRTGARKMCGAGLAETV